MALAVEPLAKFLAGLPMEMFLAKTPRAPRRKAAPPRSAVLWLNLTSVGSSAQAESLRYSDSASC
jgi:hypothetical protein